MYDQFYISLRTRNKLLGVFSAAYEVVLGLSDKTRMTSPTISYLKLNSLQYYWVEKHILILLALLKKLAQESRYQIPLVE